MELNLLQYIDGDPEDAGRVTAKFVFHTGLHQGNKNEVEGEIFIKNSSHVQLKICALFRCWEAAAQRMFLMRLSSIMSQLLYRNEGEDAGPPPALKSNVHFPTCT